MFIGYPNVDTAMIMRVKLLWPAAAVGLVLFGAINAVDDVLVTHILSLENLVEFLVISVCLILFLFILPSLRVIFSDRGVSVARKIAFGPIKVWEQNNYYLRWQDVAHVYSLFPVWLPFHMIGVMGNQGAKRRMFYLGTFMTKKQESLLYLADQVDGSVLDDEVKKLVQGYRRKLKSKNQVD